ncbi:hypothetical protein [Leekyejoonella antrihumi]|uniref:Uncharacterized protein n=1 Tax=Leekyejoonella antrihumi TaxID=1660198 RepID=A0A563E6Y3_9MICO|nr:hypothetical protein [Leekyejoonella antrihumi]TWP38290.1 hypothetical protein FGL98_03515 [Leekyejoonella antrihumi]
MPTIPTLFSLPAAVSGPLGGITLFALVISMFSRGPTKHVRAIAALAVAAALALTGAHWIAQPVAAICLATFCAYAWSSPRKSWRPLSRAVVGVVAFAAFGATWALAVVAWMSVAVFFTRGGSWRGCGARGRRMPRARRAKVSADAAAQTVESVARPVADLRAMAHDIRVPKDCRAQLSDLRDRCRVTRAYLMERGLNEGRHGYTVHEIEHSYAPEAVRAYLALPPTMANVQPLQDGKTGHQLLSEQLNLLLAAVDDEMAEATTIGGEDLLASHRFLSGKFGKRSNDLTL